MVASLESVFSKYLLNKSLYEWPPVRRKCVSAVANSKQAQEAGEWLKDIQASIQKMPKTFTRGHCVVLVLFDPSTDAAGYSTLITLWYLSLSAHCFATSFCSKCSFSTLVHSFYFIKHILIPSEHAIIQGISFQSHLADKRIECQKFYSTGLS